MTRSRLLKVGMVVLFLTVTFSAALQFLAPPGLSQVGGPRRGGPAAVLVAQATERVAEANHKVASALEELADRLATSNGRIATAWEKAGQSR